MIGPRALNQASVTAAMGQRVARFGGGLARFVRTQPLGTFGLVVCILVIVVGLIGPWIDRYEPDLATPADRLQGPNATHWFGTDHLGRDLYSRIVAGARISVYVAFFSIGIGTTAGYLVGIFSAYIGGKTDLVIQRFIDAMQAFPAILTALIIVSALGAGLDKVIIAIAFSLMASAVRISRGVVLSVKENVYVDASRVIGASPLRIMLRHILPNAMAPYLILASVALGGAILTEASLSFLGLGVPPPAASWGGELSGNASSFMLSNPWMAIFPGVAIMVVVLGFNLFGDALRDVWDPRLRGR
ncbi:MAG: ABC transporter permease [Dehalococcoidia bacterium]|nr:ABC transporter permease [Dehalococcoidia bacterium]